MKKCAVLLLVISLLCPLLCACGGEKELEPWTMPTVDSKPTPVPTAAPAFGGGSPESAVWNEAEWFDMSDPGAAEDSRQESFSHSRCAELYPYNFLPSVIFGESHAKFGKLTLKKQTHDVMLSPETGELAEHAYVEYIYAPKGGTEKNSLTVMAELCGFEASRDIFQSRIYPHIGYPDGGKPVMSRSYFSEYVLAKCGERRLAQIFRLTPSSYFADVQAKQSAAEESGESYIPARQVLLTVTCGEDMTDEEFMAAVLTLLQFSDGSEKPPVETNKLPAKGEKGAA